ncbi:MAG TPA: segregation/condensation protein A, partial [Nannocystis sp.]
MAQGSVEAAEARAAIYSVELDLFEGPLDLLLHLVRRHELDILDIPIAFVAEKYLEYLHLMRSLDLEIAGDYLVMAATLAWLKSRELLPQGPREGEQAGADDEEGEDPREALIRRLVEYERFKSAAAELDALPISGRDVFARGADIDVPPLDPGLAPVTLFRLAEAYYRVLTRAKINKTHDVTIELVTVAQRMQQLTLMLDERQEFDFEGLFLGRTWNSEHELRMMVVVTLMSVLELVKLGVARVQQVPDTDAIRVYRLVASEDARKILESYDEEQSFGAPADAAAGPPQPTEAELDALEERTLLAEALAGLDGTEEPPEPADEIGVLAEVLDPEALAEDDDFAMIPDEADLGPEAIAAPAANNAGVPAPAVDDGDGAQPDTPPDLADMSEAPAVPSDTSEVYG